MQILTSKNLLFITTITGLWCPLPVLANEAKFSKKEPLTAQQTEQALAYVIKASHSATYLNAIQQLAEHLDVMHQVVN